MARPIVDRFNTLEQWRLVTNELSRNLGDVDAIYIEDDNRFAGGEWPITLDSYPAPAENLVQEAINNLNDRKVKRSGDTINGNFNILGKFNVVDETLLEGATNILPLTGNINLAPVVGKIDLTSLTVGSINNMTIGLTTHVGGKFTTLQATTSVDLTTTGVVTINPTTAGTIDNMIIGDTLPLSGSFTDLTASTSVDLTTTGTVTINPTTIGAMDNVEIGATTPADGTFLSITSTTTSIDDVTTDSVTALTLDSDLSLSGNGTGGVVITDDNTFETGTGAVTLNGAVTIADTKSLTFTGTTGNFDMSARTSGTFKTGGGAVTLNGDITVAANKYFDMSASSGTFKTGTGAVTLGGATSCSLWFGRGAPVTKTADFTVATSENWLINNKSGSTCTVTLPTASSFTGREIYIKTIQAQTVVSATSNVIPIIGGSAATAILAATAGKWAVLVSNGTAWEIMAAG